MHQQQVIEQLLAWIEQSLDQPLTLDDIAAKSGYSKWHLQRMFKQHTGHILGTYARRRRLTAAARELRLTGTSVACIADTYQFDSQQTFTRCFRKQFGLPPASYRRSQDWSSYGLQPPLRLTETPLPQADIVTLPAMQLVGNTQRRSFTLGQLAASCELRRPPGGSCCSRRRCRRWYTASPVWRLTGNAGVIRAWPIPPLCRTKGRWGAGDYRTGEYARFTYQGQAEGLQNFIVRLYDTAMPQMNAVRRPGQDIERFYPAQEGSCPLGGAAIRCEYLIPIRRVEALAAAG